MPLNDQEREDLVAYLDGELDEVQTQALEAKLNLDAEARAEVESLRQTWGLLDYLPRAQPSPSFTNRTMQRLAVSASAVRTMVMPRPSTGKRIRRWAWAAGLLVAAAAGFAGARWLLFPPPDLDEQLVRHLPILEKWRHFEAADDLDFLRALDQPDLFGEEVGS